MLQVLLEHGANPQALMLEEVTPLHLAAAGGWIPGIEVLVGTDDIFIDRRDTLLQETPLHKAARNRHVKAIDKLSALGANRQAKNVDGLSCDEILEYSRIHPGQWDVHNHLAIWIGGHCWWAHDP